MSAVDEIVALAAGDGVIAAAAVDREVDQAGLESGRVDRVIAGKAVDGELIVGAFGAADRHLRRQSLDDDRAAIAADADLVIDRGCH